MSQPSILVRIGLYYGDLEATVRRFKSNFVRLPAVTGKFHNLASFEEQSPQYLVMISHDLSNYQNDTPNFQLTVASEDSLLNDRIFVEFSSATRIQGLRKPNSAHMAGVVRDASKTYALFLKHGEKILEQYRNRS